MTTKPSARAPATRTLTGLLVVTVAACVGGEGDIEASGAVGAWGEDDGWTLSAEPVLDLGGLGSGPEYAFTSIRTALVLDAARVVVAGAFSPAELRSYRLDGSVEWITGGDGEGPGEFGTISWVARGGGDTLVVHDSRLGRSTFVDHEGTVLGIVRLTQASNLEQPVRRQLLARFSDGSYIGFDNQWIQQGERDFGRSEVLAFRLGLDGTILDTIGPLAWGDHVPGPDGRRTQEILGKRAVYAPFGDRLLHGMGDDFTVQVYDFTGEVVDSMSRPHASRPVTDAMLEALKQQELERVQGPEAETRRASVERRYRDEPRAQTLPAYQRFLVDGEGNVWVQAYQAPGDDRFEWSVFDRDGGGFLGTLELPAAFRLTDVAHGLVAGVWTDDLDVQTLRVYRLES
jgi:hypothetical protein